MPKGKSLIKSVQKSTSVALKSTLSFRPKSYTPVLATLLLVAAFLLGVLITKVQYLEKGIATTGTQPAAQVDNTGQDTGPIAGTKVDVAVGHLPAEGDANAKVKVVIFADFRCPFCEQLYKESIPLIKKDFVDTGKAVIYFRHFAFLGDASVLAANASECANDQGKFWEMHNYFYDNQPPESDTSMFTVEKLTTVAGTLGLNTTQFSSCLTSKKFQANLDKDMSEGQAAGVSGTPATFINGILVTGAVPYSQMKTQIETSLNE
jgi:protein-disulfide isomerase